jgi:hypothetical protein
MTRDELNSEVRDGYEEGETAQQTADRLGVKHHVVYHARSRLGLREVRQPMGVVVRRARCGLCEPHECLKGDATLRTGILEGGQESGVGPGNVRRQVRGHS